MFKFVRERQARLVELLSGQTTDIIHSISREVDAVNLGADKTGITIAKHPPTANQVAVAIGVVQIRRAQPIDELLG